MVVLKAEVHAVESLESVGSGPVGREKVWELVCAFGRRIEALEFENSGCTAVTVEQDVLGQWETVYPWSSLVSAGLATKEPPTAAWSVRADDLGELESWHRISRTHMRAWKDESLVRLRIRATAPPLRSFSPARQTLRSIRLIGTPREGHGSREGAGE